MSRKQRCTPEGIPGIGWADDSIQKYNKLYDLVEEDRRLNGISFNQALLSVYTERRCIASKNYLVELHCVNIAQ